MTPPTTEFEFGDVVTVVFPFTDRTGMKRRPATVVSNKRYAVARQDVVLAAITSRVRNQPGFAEINLNDWAKAGLLKESAVKPVLFTIERSLVHKKLGRLSAHDRAGLKGMLKDILG